MHYIRKIVEALYWGVKSDLDENGKKWLYLRLFASYNVATHMEDARQHNYQIDAAKESRNIARRCVPSIHEDKI